MKQSFITWKGWKSTFARWNLWLIVAIHAVCGYGFVVAGHWAGYAFACAVILAVWIGGYINWRALLKIDHTHPNGHHAMLWDAATYTCIHGVKPHKITKVCAWPIGHAEGTPEPTEEQRRIRNYPRP